VFENSELTIPPLAEQRRIVARVEALLRRVQAARARLAKVPALLKRFRKSVLAATCSGELTKDWRVRNPVTNDAAEILMRLNEAHAAAGGHKRGNAAEPTEEAHDLSENDLPATWALTDLRTAVSPDRPITYGILKPGPETPGGVPYVRVADFPNDRLNLDTIRRTTRDIEQSYARARLRTGDLLLSIRGSVGRVCVVPSALTDANITQDTARLSIQPELHAAFVMWFLRAPMTQNRMQRALKGVAVRGINIGDVRAIQLPVPPLVEQQEIVRRVEALFALADKIESRVALATQRVERTTQAILAKAFRGELVPTDAELARQQNRDYEPATALLERIRAEREAAGAAPPKGPRRRTQRT
jgi:type I restriction enzyme, S subunit